MLPLLPLLPAEGSGEPNAATSVLPLEPPDSASDAAAAIERARAAAVDGDLSATDAADACAAAATLCAVAVSIRAAA